MVPFLQASFLFMSSSSFPPQWSSSLVETHHLTFCWIWLRTIAGIHLTFQWTQRVFQSSCPILNSLGQCKREQIVPPICQHLVLLLFLLYSGGPVCYNSKLKRRSWKWQWRDSKTTTKEISLGTEQCRGNHTSIIHTVTLDKQLDLVVALFSCLQNGNIIFKFGELSEGVDIASHRSTSGLLLGYTVCT